MGADAELIGNAMARSVPGGIALQRAIQVAPDANQNFLTSLAAPAQKFYADYDSPTPDGMVPVYKSDGSLVDYQQPTSLILRALGVNLSLPQYSRDIDGYMVKQRAKMNDYRRKWIEAAIRDSDVAEAERINQRFLREYGFRLPVTKDPGEGLYQGRRDPTLSPYDGPPASRDAVILPTRDGKRPRAPGHRGRRTGSAYYILKTGKLPIRNTRLFVPRSSPSTQEGYGRDRTATCCVVPPGL